VFYLIKILLDTLKRSGILCKVPLEHRVLAVFFIITASLSALSGFNFYVIISLFLN